MHDNKLLFKCMEPLQVKVMCPISLLVQLPEGCKDDFIKVEGRKCSYTAKGNIAQQQLGVKPATSTPQGRKDSQMT